MSRTMPARRSEATQYCPCPIGKLSSSGRLFGILDDADVQRRCILIDIDIVSIILHLCTHFEKPRIVNLQDLLCMEYLDIAS